MKKAKNTPLLECYTVVDTEAVDLQAYPNHKVYSSFQELVQHVATQPNPAEFLANSRFCYGAENETYVSFDRTKENECGFRVEN